MSSIDAQSRKATEIGTLSWSDAVEIFGLVCEPELALERYRVKAFELSEARRAEIIRRNIVVTSSS